MIGGGEQYKFINIITVQIVPRHINNEGGGEREIATEQHLHLNTATRTMILSAVINEVNSVSLERGTRSHPTDSHAPSQTAPSPVHTGTWRDSGSGEVHLDRCRRDCGTLQETPWVIHASAQHTTS